MNEIKVHEWDTKNYVKALTVKNGYVYFSFDYKIIQCDVNGTQVHEWHTTNSAEALTVMNGYVYFSSGCQYYGPTIFQWDANGTQVRY